MILALAFVSTLAEANPKRIHVTAKIEKTTLIGDPDEPKIGDQRITGVVLLDKHNNAVGTGAGSKPLHVVIQKSSQGGTEQGHEHLVPGEGAMLGDQLALVGRSVGALGTMLPVPPVVQHHHQIA